MAVFDLVIDWFGSGVDCRRTATSGSSAPRSHCHKTVLSPAVLTFELSSTLMATLAGTICYGRTWNSLLPYILRGVLDGDTSTSPYP